jgi:sterol carrier protein 2
MVWHLRGWATNRAKPHTKHCLQHNVGLGGAVVVTMYKRPDDSEAPMPEESKKTQEDGRKWAGYNPAVEARWISKSDLDRVKSRANSAKMQEGWKPYQGETQARL